MSSSIAIPTRNYSGESSKAAASSSSSSSYSSSPRTPQQQSTPGSNAPSPSPSTIYGHNRRRSLLSKSRDPLHLLLLEGLDCGLSRSDLGDLGNFYWLPRMSYSATANNHTGTSFTKQEHTVVNIGDPDGVPRLVGYSASAMVSLLDLQLANSNPGQITCVRSSQGFDWNPGRCLSLHTNACY